MLTAADAMPVAAAYIPLAPVPRRLRCMWVLLCNLVIVIFVIITVISIVGHSSQCNGSRYTARISSVHG